MRLLWYPGWLLGVAMRLLLQWLGYSGVVARVPEVVAKCCYAVAMVPGVVARVC